MIPVLGRISLHRLRQSAAGKVRSRNKAYAIGATLIMLAYVIFLEDLLRASAIILSQGDGAASCRLGSIKVCMSFANLPLAEVSGWLVLIIFLRPPGMVSGGKSLRIIVLFLVVVLGVFTLSAVLAEDVVEPESLWTFLVEKTGGDGTTHWVSSDPAHKVVEDSVAEIDISPGQIGRVAVWIVAHNDEFTQPRIYMLQIDHSADFPDVTAELASEGIGPEALDFGGKPDASLPDSPGNYPWNQYATPVYDVFPGSYGTAVVSLDDQPKTWDLDPQAAPQSYIEKDLLDEAAKAGNDDAYAVVDLRFVGATLGTYILHIDSVAETLPAGASPDYEWNPYSHGATVIVNIVPVLPVAAGAATFGLCFGGLWIRRRRD